MARERKTKVLEVDSSGAETKIEVQQLGAYESLRLLHRLTKAVGPAIAKAGSGAGKLSLADVDIGNLAEAAELFFANFSEQDLEVVTRQLIGESLLTCVVNGKSQTGPANAFFAPVFDGRPDLLIKAVLFAIEVNYEKFFTAARGLLAARATVGSQSTSLPTS